MIESIIETQAQPVIGANLTGTLDAIASGATAVAGTGTNFDPEVSPGDILTFLDTAGARKYYTVDTVTDDTNIVLSQPTNSASSGGITYGIATMQSPYIVGGDAVALSPNELAIYCPVFGFIMTSTNPLSLAPGIIDRFFSFNEGALMKSIYVRLPYQYTQTNRNLTLRFFYTDPAGANILLIDEIGSEGKLPIPIENIETPLNIYIPPAPESLTSSVNWGILAEISGCGLNQDDPTGGANFGSIQAQPMLSDVDAPPTLDGEIMPIIIGLRVLHATNLVNS